MASSDKNPLQYNRLLDFKKDIKEALQQTQIQAEILTKMTREKGLLPPGNASYEIALLVSYCIDNVGLNEQLFSKFLEFLKDAGQVHLVRRILVKVPTQQSAERDSRAPPSSASTRTRTQSLPHVLLSARRPSKSAVTRPPRVKSASLPDRGKLQQPLPPRVNKAPLVPVEEAQEDEAKEGLVLPPAQQSTPTRIVINNRNPLFGTREPETVNTELEAEIQELREDKESLTKEVQEKVKEIRVLKAEKKIRKKELEGYKTKTAELEQKLQQKDDESKEQEKHFSEQEMEIKLQYEKDINDLKEQIKEEEHKTKKKELEIKELEKQLLQKELEKVTLIRKYEDEKRAGEREREELKVELAERKSEDEKRKRIVAEHKQEEEEQKRKKEERKCKAAEEEKEEEERKRKAAEEEKEEEERKRKAAEEEKEEEKRKRKAAEEEKEEEEWKRKAAERGHRQSLDKIKQLEELLKSNGITK